MPALLRVLEVGVGALVVVAMVTDVFQSVVLPRSASWQFRVSGQLSRRAWPLWRWFTRRIKDDDKREDTLGLYAPLLLVCLIAMWVAGLIVGFGTIFYGLREQVKPEPTLGEAFYFAGASLLTIGFGDVVPVTWSTRLLALLAGASGFGVVAVCTAFIFATFASFQQREVFVVTFSSSAGAPPSGVNFIEAYTRLGLSARLDAVFEQAHTWSAAMLDNHLAYPILAYFRSSHDEQSWVGTLGAVLDASTLVLTVTANLPTGQASLMNSMGRHLVHDLCRYFKFEASDEGEPGVERAEFEVARARLAEAGLAVRDADEAWARFASIRGTYAASLNAMARWWDIPPAQWVGDRSLLPSPHDAMPAPDYASVSETVAGTR